MASSYAWIIDKDFHPITSEPEGTNSNAKGMTGPSDINEALLETEGKRFRMYDDDFSTDLADSRMYEGRYFGEGNVSDEQFEPLDDFGMPNTGCTVIAYLEKEAPRYPESVVEKTDAGYWVML